MKFKLCLVIYILFNVQLHAQTTIDSLQTLLKNTKDDTTKIKLYSILSDFSDENNIPLYTKPGLEIAEKLIKNYLATSINKNTIESDLSNKIPAKLKKTILNYYSRLLNSQGVFEISKGNNPAGIAIFEKALRVQMLNKDTLQMANTLNNIGTNLFYMGNITKATDAINESLKLFIYLKDKRGIAQCYNGLSITSRSNGDILKGIDYIFKSLKISEELKDEEAIANFYNSLCVYYLDLEDYSNALQYGEKSLKLGKKLNSKRTMSNAYNGIAYVYKKQNNLKKSLEYLNFSLKISEELGDKNQLVTSYNNVGVLLKDQKNYNEAINFYQKSLALAIEIEAPDGIANSNYKLGEVYLLQNNITKALPFALTAIKISKQLCTPTDIRNAAALLKEIYEKANKYKEALEMTKLYYTMRDSIVNDNTKREAIGKKFKYDYDKKSMTDSIKNVEQKKIATTKISLQNAEINNQNTIRAALIIGIVIIALFLVFIFTRLRATSKQKAIIEEQTHITEIQKNELELKNINILQSIQAAKDIQYSVFPNKLELESVFKDYFILFKPFDNLSGDFLWLKSLNDKTFLLLGDCTGHGIPASLLTLLANEFLNKIILQKQITSASQILQEVNIEIHNYLQRKQKSKKSLNEGMDIAICIIDKKRNQLTYCGAKIDLYIVNNNNELKIAQSHTIELGKQQNLTNINEHVVLLNQTKGLFLTTDGFKDQLKYRSNKTKFGFKGFENFIQTNYHLPFSEQSTNLKILYSKLISPEKQIDDILVFGFKL